jgi:hypothetical protein
VIKPWKSKEYIDPESQTPKLVITKNNKLEEIEVIKTFLKFTFFRKK